MPTIVLPSVGPEVRAHAAIERPFSTRKADEMAEAVRARLAAQPSGSLAFRETTELQAAVVHAASQLTGVSESMRNQLALRKKEQARQRLESALRQAELAERRRINERMSRALGLDRPRTVSLMSSPLNSGRARLERPVRPRSSVATDRRAPLRRSRADEMATRLNGRFAPLRAAPGADRAAGSSGARVSRGDVMCA